MSFAPKVKAEAREERFYGFREDGSSFMAKTKVENVWTRAVWHLCREIDSRSLRPYEAALYINKEADSVRGMFDPAVMRQWARLDRYSHWRMAQVGSPALSTLKYRGAGVPLFPEDEPRWADRCRMVARIHSEDDEVEPVLDLPAFFATLMKTPQMTESQLIAERDRQLAAFRSQNPESGE